MISRRSFLAATGAALPAAVAAGADEPAKSAVTARPEDVGTIDAIIAATYDVVSGPAAKARDWDRLRSLLVPDARLILCSAPASGKPALRTHTTEEFVRRFTPIFAKEGYFEREVARKVDRFGHIAHAFSTYEGRREPDAKPYTRGINSFQLFHDGARWWVVTIYWEFETPTQPIPAEYAPEA